MASYLRGWISSQFTATEPIPQAPTIVSPPDDDDDDTATIRGEDDDDAPPAFPSLNSAQRLDPGSQPSAALASSSVPRILSDSDRMPPPPMPGLSTRRPGAPEPSSSLGVPPSAGSLAPPPSTTKAPKKPSRKVALAPGHGPLDWANLKKSGQDLRVRFISLALCLLANSGTSQGVDTLMRVTPSMLKQHNKKDDAWSAFNGKVYNITAYLPYHPGGEKELFRVAGRDGTKLFCAFTYLSTSSVLLTPIYMIL